MPGESGTGGLLASLRGLFATALGLLRTRTELLVVELEEERARLIDIVLLAVVCCFFLGFGLVLLTVFCIVLFWQTHPLLVTGLLATLFLGCGLLAGWRLRRRLQRGSQLFAASLKELQDDVAALRGQVLHETEHEA